MFCSSYELVYIYWGMCQVAATRTGVARVFWSIILSNNSIVADVFEGAEEQFVHMFVHQRVVDELSGTPEFDQIGVPENPELVGDG